MRKDIKEAKILNNSLKKAKTFDRKDWRKNKKAGSDKKLAGLISLLGGKMEINAIFIVYFDVTNKPVYHHPFHS